MSRGYAAVASLSSALQTSPAAETLPPLSDRLQSRLANKCPFSYLGAADECSDTGTAMFALNSKKAGIKWRITYEPAGAPA